MKKKNQEEGFTLTEVLLSILISTLFVSSSLQLMLASSLMRIKANQRSEATKWIREQIEQVRLTAATDDLSDGTCGEYSKALRETLSHKTPKSEVDERELDESEVDERELDESEVIDSGVIDSGVEVNLDTTKNVGGQNIWLKRTMTDNGDSLQLAYSAVLEDTNSPGSPGNEVIAQFYTEVIANAAFNCQE
ncbi:MAG: type II secretion system protein [Prochloraceae cyanobacterium]|nr:type II secretion system protein [Prochloraceae cyanobacterium]